MKRLVLGSFALFLLACGGTTVVSGSTGSGGAGTTSTSGTSSTTGGGGSATTSTSTTGTGMGGCAPACDLGFTCCGGACVNLSNDIKNCGTCGQTCLGDQPFCGGTCGDPPCDAVVVCSGTQFCCGMLCCDEGMLCCDVQGPGPSTGVKCVPPDNGTCPRGCPTCE